MVTPVCQLSSPKDAWGNLKAKEMESKKKGEPKESKRKEEPILAMSDWFEREREREGETWKIQKEGAFFFIYWLCTMHLAVSFKKKLMVNNFWHYS
jgi:hypothetical protein